MPRTNVLVKTVDGEKKVFLREWEYDVFPRTFKVIKEAIASDSVSDHNRTCDFDSEAESYFNRLRKKDHE